MKHWSFLFSYLVAPKGAVCLFVCFSSKAMEFFLIIAFTEEFLPVPRAQATGTSCHDLHIWFSAETL